MGLLEVHAYSVMTNHFHLLVRSPVGQLAEAMRLTQNRYVRWFNRRARRDGPLFRGRFRSRQVEGLRYRRHLVAYIDGNPVEAGLVSVPELYPHGSAFQYVRLGGPIWLARRWVEREAQSLTGDGDFTAETHRRAFGRPLSDHERGLVEARLASPSRAPDPLDDLLAAGPEGVGSWLRRKAQNADGSRPGLPCASPARVQEVIETHAAAEPNWLLVRGTKRLVVWTPMAVGLMRDLACASYKEVQERTGLGPSAVRRAYDAHREWVEEEARYGAMVGRIGAACVGD